MRATSVLAVLMLAAVPAWGQNALTRGSQSPPLFYGDGLLAWDAVPGSEALVHRAYIDTVPGLVLPSVSCAVDICTSDLDRINPWLTQPGTHTLALTAANGLGESARSNALQVTSTNPLATCPYTAPGGVTEQRPLGAGLQGFVPFNKVPGDNYAGTRVFQLRRDGWRVEWQLQLNGAGLFLIATCTGLPQ